MKIRPPFPRALAITALAAAAACASPPQSRVSPAFQRSKEPTKKMSPQGQVHLELTAASAEGRSRLLPGEAAMFDLIFRNLSTHEERFESMTGNAATPVFQLYDSAGHLLGHFDPVSAQRRTSGHVKFAPAPPEMVYLRNGVQDGTAVNLWDYTDPLPPGIYRLDVSHQPTEGAAFIHANAVTFEIVPAIVTQAAMTYGTSDHANSLLSWIARAADGKTPPELLIRLSANGNTGMIFVGATPAGPVDKDVALASSSLPPFSEQGQKGWLAIASGEKLELLHHAMAHLDWRSGPIPLPLTHLQPISGFPDRERALFLATGRAASGAALLGLALTSDPARDAMPPDTRPTLQPGPSESMGADPDALIDPGPPPSSPRPMPTPPPAPVKKRELPPYHPWTIPLKGEPIRAAAAFDAEGPVSVLLVYDDNGQLRLSRIDVDEAGRVVAPEKSLLTGHESTGILAIAVDKRKGYPISFVVLAADRQEHNRLALIRLPLEGAPVSRDFPGLAGWPMKADNGHHVPFAAAEAAMDIAQDGTPWLAMVDENGRLYGGPLDGSALRLLRDHGKCSHPFVAALAEEVTPGCFTETGELFPEGHGTHAH